MNISIIKDDVAISQIAKLFDEYRVFYNQKSDIIGAETFLQQHLINNTSILIAASFQEKMIGFVQLYPCYSSVSMQKLYILNDLYVNTNHRQKGVGASLIKTAEELAKKEGWKGLILETGIDNPAQKLYEKMGWVMDKEYLHYSWTV